MSGYFDPLDKKNKPVLDYFEDKTWLIVDPSTSTRTSIKKSIMQIGVKVANISDTDNINIAKEIIATKKPNYLLGNKTITGGTTMSLYKAHSEASPNRIKSGFFIIADESSLSEVAYALEYEMDGMIITPFTGLTIIECLVNSLIPKLTPTPYLMKIEEGREHFMKGNFTKAEEIFQSAMMLTRYPYEANYFLGQIFEANKEISMAITAYEDSVTLNSGYFKALNRLSQLYYQQKDFKKAYEVNVSISEKYPTPPNKIPELIKLSIINKKYEDINNYLKLFNAIESPDIDTQKSLSAGLAVLGKHFFSMGEEARAIDALKVAFRYCNGKYEIVKSLVQSFEEHHQLDILAEMFNQTELSHWSDNVQALYFYTLNLTSKDDHNVILVGEQMLKRNIKDVLIYKGLIERGIKLKRKSGVIEGLILEAIKSFPAHKSEFENYQKKN